MLTAAKKAFYRARGYVRGHVGGDPFRLDPYHSKFWKKAERGAWEPETFEVLEAHLSKERDYIDIGAWIGPTVLFAANRARHVWCFEPDPDAFRALTRNLSLNGIGNVSALPVALSNTAGVARMASFRGGRGDSMTSLLKANAADAVDVATLGWNDFAGQTNLSAVSLVKMDIEGAEFFLLPTLLEWLQAHRPAFYLSTHAPYLAEDVRREKMGEVARLLAFYPRVTDSRTGRTGFHLLTEPEALTGFQSFVFHSA
ncbi:hypothetical protein GCM10011316_18130 [Roseibium aquae]|uniref:Methyltransferase FkbM domain-containing protein n=1 Tax=Roseibium aquae TaxID=1323746 RepID=A0A916THZ1_9HYPH|nr:FkbM family methyltransferase [Roseibium aquae]GGB46393.1 hypothetical protein GCM10011316_18130 [Roseibium aquae]